MGKQAQGVRNRGESEREEEERKIVDVMCCDVVADRRSHGVPATRRGAECCIIARIRAAVGGRVAGVLMRVRMWGALAEKTRRGSSPEWGSSPGIVMMMMMM